MKILFILTILNIPTSFADIVYDCQCFDNQISSTVLGGIRLYEQSSLKAAEKEAVKTCKKDLKEKKLIARCHAFVVADH
jgi:hypothetical protein